MERTNDINIMQLLRALLQRIWLIILCAVLLGAAAYGYTVKFVPPTYQARISLYVHSSNMGASENGAISSSDLVTSQRLVSTYISILKSDRVLDKVSEAIDNRLGASAISGMISASSMNNTEAFEVTVTAQDPNLAADIANAIADVAPEEISRIIEGGSTKVIDYAKVPAAPISPDKNQNTMYGMLIGAVLAACVIVIQTLMDIRIKSEEDLQQLSDKPILGLIPDLAVEIKGKAGYSYQSYAYQADPAEHKNGGKQA